MVKLQVKKNDVFIAEIEDITNLGFGVARYMGRVVFVPDTVPGDQVEIKIIKVGASFCVGKAISFLSYSGHRVDYRCQNGKCRSCAYRNIHILEESRVKEAFVKGEMKKAGLSHIGVLTLVQSPKEREYRNKAQYPVSKNPDGSIKIGFFAPKSHRVCEAADCPLSPGIFSEILNTLRAFFEKYEISVYNEESGEGLLRHIYLRRGEISGEILLTIVINGERLPKAFELCREITEKYPDVVGILLNTNRESTNVILGEEYATLYGREYIYDTLAGVKLKLSAPAFYQVNHGVAELIYARARELADLKAEDTLLDLYCGAGSIGLSMARDAGRVIGIEIVPDAVRCARKNAVNNGIENAYFFTGDAQDTEKLLAKAEANLGKITPRVVILDPPRAGCDEKLLNYVASLNAERIVYISCNPTTLARDMKHLEALNYTTNQVEIFNMFPMTGHVESVVCLKRQIQQ
jgi:23S rRNA (uracil1939-C5)-methyltransferase